VRSIRKLHRQLSDLEATAADGTPRKDVEPKAPLGRARQPADPERCRPGAAAASDPRVERSTRVCTARRGLAALHDPRAFGLLLQLSREEQPPARVEVCWAMAALGDPRVRSRLRSLLQDADASVRDAACTALLRAYANEPLAAADVILNAPHEDVRRRGLQMLLDTVRTIAPTATSRALLLRALNDASAHVRRETFKAVLICRAWARPRTSGSSSCRAATFDVRRGGAHGGDGQISEPWAWPLLLSFLNDPETALRDEALAFGCKKFKERES